MTVEQIISEKEKLDQIRARLEKKQKLVNSKERKMRLRKIIELGELIVKSGLENLELGVLFGALLDVKDMSKSNSALKKWAEKNEAWGKQHQPHRLIVSIKSNASEELRAILKSRKFRWNAFRQEWYGYGQKDELEIVLGKENAEITEVAE